MSRLLLRALLCAFLLCSAIAAEESPEADTTVVTHPVPDAWISDIAAPLQLEARSKTGGTLHLSFAGREQRQIHRVRLAPGVSTRIEIPIYPASMVEWSLGAESGVAHVGWPYRYSSEAPLITVNAFLLRELESAEKAGGKRVLSSIAAEDLPSDWRACAGLQAVVVMSTRDAESLTPAQSRALAQWIAWWGGVVWIAGEDADAARALDKLGLPLAQATVTPRPHGRDVAYANGLVKLTATPDAAVIYADRSAPPVIFDPGFIGGGTDLLDNLGEIPVSFIVLSLVVLGILLGPVAYLIVRRRKNPLLLFCIVPAIAIPGTAAIVVGALFLEGTGGEYNGFALLARRADDTSAMFYDMRGVRAGILPPELRFAPDTLALPFDSNDGTATLDTTDGVRMVSGWLRPRFASGYLTMRPVTSRMNIEVDSTAVTNNLGFTVKRVAVRLPDGGFAYAENIPPGESAALERERAPRRYEQLKNSLGAMTRDRAAPVTNPLLIAETDGLPYADDGGLDGTPRDATFFYVIAGNRPAPEETEEEDE